MINSPNFDKSDLQLTSSVIELATRIYGCRVDNVHLQVLSVASDITPQQKRKEKESEDNEADKEDGGDAFEDDEEDDVGRRKRQRKKTTYQPGVGDEGFDNDVELPRDMVQGFGAQRAKVNDDEFQPACSGPPLEAGVQFQSSLPDGLINVPLSGVADVNSIRFSRKPKPIDMSALKKAIFKTLVSELPLDSTGQPLKEEETKVGLALLMFKVLQAIDSRTEKLLSVSLFVVALMHVVAEKTLFVNYDDSDPACPVVICRGKKMQPFPPYADVY